MKIVDMIKVLQIGKNYLFQYCNQCIGIENSNRVQKSIKQFPVVIIIALCMILSAHVAFGANFYVRPNGGSYGSEDGSDWDNAFDGFSDISWSSVSCGDTIWAAGGTYTQTLSPQKKCTDGNQLYIRRARSDATECTSASGWTASFASTITQTSTPGISFDGDYDYITISGRTTASGGTYGWIIDRTGYTTGIGIDLNAGGSDYNTVEYIELKGMGRVNVTASTRGIDNTPSSGANTHNTFSHLKIYDWSSGVYEAQSYSTYEYVDVYDNTCLNVSSHHNNGFYLASPDNLTIRYSKIHGQNGQSTFFGGYGSVDSISIYGNFYYDMVQTGDAGIKFNDSIAGATNIHINNNSFYNLTATSPIIVEAGVSCSGETRNNLGYSTPSIDVCGTGSNNTVASSNPFVDAESDDFHLSEATADGYTLSSPYDVDVDGNERGADGTWDIGAYEFGSGSGGSPLPPGIPRNLHIDSQ